MIFPHGQQESSPYPRAPGQGSGSSLGGMTAYHPLLLHRPTDYSVNSLLGSTHPHYVPGVSPFASPHITASILPKLQQTVARAPLTPADFLAHQHAFRAGHLRPLEPPEADVQDDPKVELEGKELWENFHNFGTEMVITKSGRSVILY